ncbi:MAG: hypothetical protein QUS13_02515 [Smithella sp.]|nr:hypothetical protein [Smithella sp.]
MDKKLSVQLEFTESGYLKAILLNADRERDQQTLERALSRLMKSDHSCWLRRLFKYNRG